MARVDSLPEGTKNLLQKVSIVGREFSYNLIKRVTDLAEQELLSHLSVLKDSELLYERGIYPQSTYIFKHVLTQEVAYNSLLLKKRKEIHEKIGKAIEALYPDRLEEHYELLAYHYASSANKDRAVQYLDLANQKAAKLNAMEEAKAYFDEAMELLDTLPEDEKNQQRRISLLVNQGIVIMLLVFKYQEYYDLLTRYEPMARGLGNPELLGAFYARLGDCEYSFGNYARAIQRSTKAAELAEVSGNVEEAEYAYIRLEWSYFMRGDFDRVLALKEDLLRMMEQQFNLRWHTYTVSIASRAYGCLGRWEKAIEEGQKALKVAQEFSDNSMISWSASNLSIAYTWRGDLARAVEYGELAHQKAPTPGDKAFAQRSLGWAWCRAGEINRGIELLTAVLPIFRAGFIASEIPLTCYLGEGHWLAGEDNKARLTLEKGLEIAERCGTRYYAGFAQRLLGEITLKTNPAQAVPYFEKSIAIFREIKAENELALAYAGYGRYRKQRGQIAQAREYLKKALEIFERLGTLIEPDKVREILAELPEA
jgi:tetratricopeptide (TPR) repeat protein